MAENTPDISDVEALVHILEIVPRSRQVLHWSISLFRILHPQGLIPLTPNDSLSLKRFLRSNYKFLTAEDVKDILERLSSLRYPIIEVSSRYIIQGKIREEDVPIIMKEYWTRHGFDVDNHDGNDSIEH